MTAATVRHLRPGQAVQLRQGSSPFDGLQRGERYRIRSVQRVAGRVWLDGMKIDWPIDWFEPIEDSEGEPSRPETFSFTEWRRGADGHVRVIKTHVAYDSRWPWIRRAWANLRGRP